MQSKKILFFGNERLATGVTTKTPVIKSLLKAGYEIAAIIIAPLKDNPSRSKRQLEIVQVAQEHAIPLLEIDSLKNELDSLKQYNATIGILVAYGKIVPQSIIDMLPKGIINLHPSLLPKHRGPTPVESVILAGETLTGVSLMQLVAAMDAGPVYDQVNLEINGRMDKQQLADQLGAIGAERLIKLLPAILSGQAIPKAQDDNTATYDHKISQDNAKLDFTKPADLLVREVTAFYGWPRSRAIINNQPVVITQAHALSDLSTSQPGKIWLQDNNWGFETSDGVLIIDKLIPAGGKEMSGADYLRGHTV